MKGTPSLSVVLVWRDPSEGVVEALHTLIGPVEVAGGEVIVVSGLPANMVEAARSSVVGARWIGVEPPATEPRAWGSGVEAARGPIVAFGQARCRYDSGWAPAILAAGVGPGRVATGPVLPAPGLSIGAMAAYLCDYGAFADPEGDAGGAVSSNNAAFDRRDLIAAVAADGLWKPRLLASGHLRPTWATGMRATIRPTPAIVARFHRGRAFAALRSSGWPRAIRLLAGLACPALPPRLLARLIGDRHLRHRHASALARGAPWIGAALLSWSLGELSGYWFGAGGSGCHL